MFTGLASDIASRLFAIGKTFPIHHFQVGRQRRQFPQPVRQWNAQSLGREYRELLIVLENLSMESERERALGFEGGLQPSLSGGGKLGRQTGPHLLPPPALRKVDLPKIIEQTASLCLDLSAQGDQLRSMAGKEALLLFGG